ncbi:hypothetical protein OGAPHI_003920 [Ogataea philodendri]|uniref:DNA repair protein RAD4 n=1 Tax=Ogataea philodendri TaxID=1378263 RepID=A0A9P8P5R1_9ASCO|nr:uncharacterized protein OGAPHI_003920 [Ogataea philodendri]KAH3665732.1 hypothetical protein OGAPHI_003920 [Ogataea philodendri]
MSYGVPKEYREMLAEALEESSGSERSHSSERPLKRRDRRRRRSRDVEVVEGNSLRVSSPPSGATSHAPIELSDTDNRTSSPQSASRPVSGNEVISIDSDDSNDDDYSGLGSDDFEDVDLSGAALDYQQAEELSGEITVTVSRPTKRKERKTNLVSSDERMFRRTMHLMYLFAMVGHGVVRNSWCSDATVLKAVRARVPSKLMRQVDQHHEEQLNSETTAAAKSRRLLDLLRHLMNYWNRAWSVDAKNRGLYRKSWEEIAKFWNHPPSPGESLTKARFLKRLEGCRGTRDLQAQGFVALLRSLDINCRLVFSLQPPDFTNLAVLSRREQTAPEKTPSPAATPRKRKAPSQHERLLSALRVNRPAYANFRPEQQEEVQYPVFWVEVWDSASKRFISIDPAVQRYIEVVGARSKFYWPNNTSYVLAFDRLGGVRDVTRRYCENYNAKIRKKRITRDPKGQEWYDKLLQGANSKVRSEPNKIDRFEQLEFEERSLKEGMPNSLQDFVNHPVYVLESQLKFNEVLKPKISCGTVRKKTKAGQAGDLIPVYRRSNVVTVRSAKAWFLLGRVLKVGEQALKVKDQRKQRHDEDNYEAGDDEEEVRLYGEYQTEKYVAPPIVDGKIPRNAYGNIDIYQPWMVPDGAVHVADKRAERAARLLEVDYAPAAVGFDFGSGGRGRGASVSVKIVGAVVLEEHREAVQLVCEYLQQQEEDAARRRREAGALRVWALVLAKLRITRRLDQEHGLVDEEEEEEEEKQEAAGGFIFGEAQYNQKEPSEEPGGFETGGFEVDAGGFEPQEADSGGFMSEPVDHGGFEPESTESGGFVLEPINPSPRPPPPASSETSSPASDADAAFDPSENSEGYDFEYSE